MRTLFDEPRYRIVRHFQNEKYHPVVVKDSLTLEEAQAHCRNPQTSSKTATDIRMITYTEEFGEWFDGYELMT